MITKIGALIEHVKESVRYGVSPHSPVVVRVGDNGEEMQIEHVKVQGGFQQKLVIQLKARG